MDMADSTIRYEVADGVATITFNRPEVRNAFNDQMAEEMQTALRSAERDASARWLVSAGAGAGFCPGNDRAGLHDRGEALQFRDHLQRTYNPIVAKLASIEKPVV